MSDDRPYCACGGACKTAKCPCRMFGRHGVLCDPERCKCRSDLCVNRVRKLPALPAAICNCPGKCIIGCPCLKNGRPCSNNCTCGTNCTNQKDIGIASLENQMKELSGIGSRNDQSDEFRHLMIPVLKDESARTPIGIIKSIYSKPSGYFAHLVSQRDPVEVYMQDVEWTDVSRRPKLYHALEKEFKIVLSDDQECRIVVKARIVPANFGVALSPQMRIEVLVNASFRLGMTTARLLSSTHARLDMLHTVMSTEKRQVMVCVECFIVMYLGCTFSPDSTTNCFANDHQ